MNARIARGIAWYLAALLSLAIVVAATSYYLQTILEGYTAGQLAVNPSPAAFVVDVLAGVLTLASGLLSLYLAFLLFRRRPKDRMALFLSFYLLAFTILAGPLQVLNPILPFNGVIFGWTVVFPLVMYPASSFLFVLFPDGRFSPDWSRWVARGSLLIAPVIATAFLISFRSNTPNLGSIIGTLLLLVGISSAMYAQFYRYRHIASQQQKRQIKWFVYGLGMMLAMMLINAIPYIWTFTLPESIPQPIWDAASLVQNFVYYAILPVSLTIAILRHQLYDIDILINRTLVYGALTGSVIVLYALMVGAFGVLFQSGGNLIVALVATGLVAVLFQPLRARLQKGVNHLMYGDRDEPFTVLRRLGERLESSGMPEDTLSAIVETVAQTLKLPAAEITLRRGERFECAARSGKFANERAPFPIHYQGQTIGYLNVAPRGAGESLAESDKGLLRQIARQAGPVAYAVQLTRDLRQSRARLVTAREEERRRLRRDLHDGLGPVLASQGLKIAAVSHLLDNDPETARKLLDELASQNEATVAEIRRLVYGLRPPELDELGLAGAVREFATKLDTGETNDGELIINVQPSEGELPGLPAAVEVAAYRIATEALTNVTRHARARHCTVSFKVEPNGSEKVLRIEIRDDGVGLTNSGRAGIGMNSMRERVEEVQGELQIESSPSQGTRVVASMPLRD